MQCDLLSVRDLGFSYADEETLKGIGLDVGRGEFVALMGPNGSGKTTTMRCMNQILKGTGTVTIDGTDMSALQMSEIARICTTVPADTSTDFVLSVRDFVSLGRSPFVTNLWWEGDEDTEIIDRAMRSLDLERYADRRLSELSSGERARVLLAKGMAQTPKVMLVDEPSAHLDIKYKVQIMEILSALSRTGLGIVIASHDVNLITRFCDRILLLSEGRIVAYGRPADVVTVESVREVFGIDVEIVRSGGVPYILPTGSTGFELNGLRGPPLPPSGRTASGRFYLLYYIDMKSWTVHAHVMHCKSITGVCFVLFRVAVEEVPHPLCRCRLPVPSAMNVSPIGSSRHPIRP